MYANEIYGRCIIAIAGICVGELPDIMRREKLPIAKHLLTFPFIRKTLMERASIHLTTYCSVYPLVTGVLYE